MSKKFYLFSIALLCVLACLLYFIVVKIKMQPNANSMPNFTFYTLQQKPFRSTHIPKQQNYLIVHFSPDCHYCTEEIDDIIRHKAWFKSCFILLVSPSPIKQLREYNDYLTTKNLNYIILQDSKYQFSNFFGPSSIPSGYLYAQNKKLVKKFDGATKAQYLYAFINERK